MDLKNNNLMCKYNMRIKSHNLSLPPKDDINFIARQLYNKRLIDYKVDLSFFH